MKLLLVDDHPLFAICFTHSMAHTGAGIDVDTALTIDDGLRRAAWGSPDVVLIDESTSATRMTVCWGCKRC